jgi:hypothetical protein
LKISIYRESFDTDKLLVCRNGHNVVLNKEAGHLLRTKVSNSDEGGVAAGFAVLDSPYLT